MQMIEGVKIKQKMMYDVRFIVERQNFLNINEKAEIQKVLVFPTKVSKEYLTWIVHTYFNNVKRVSYINEFGKGCYMEK